MNMLRPKSGLPRVGKARFVVLALPMLAAGLAAIALGQGQSSAPASPASQPAGFADLVTMPAASAGTAQAAGPATAPATAPATFPASAPATSPASAPATQAAASAPVIPMPVYGGKASTSAGDDQGKLLWEMASRLAIVLAMAVVALLVIKKLLPRLGKGSVLSKKHVRIVETTYLGPKKTLHVVEIGTKRYLLAGCGDQVRFMTDVTEAFKDEGPEES